MTGKIESSRIPTLDGLRAAAIILVITSHAFLSVEAMVKLGHMGVLIFFALSGYLITTKLVEEYRARGVIDLRAFYARRAFRILPPALTYLVVLSILFSLGWVACDVKSIAAAVFFWINYLPVEVTAWKARHFWSLSVEEHFYLLWPALLILSGVAKGWRAAAFLAMVICVWRTVGFDYHSIFHTDYIADTLLWGCCLAFVPSRRIGLPTIVALALLALFWIVGSLHGRLALAILHLLPSLILGVIVMSPRSWVGQFLELPPLRYLGKLSYSLYIWQEMFLGGSPLLPTPLGILAAFACAYLSYRFVEQPCIRFGHQWISARSVKVGRPLATRG